MSSKKTPTVKKKPAKKASDKKVSSKKKLTDKQKRFCEEYMIDLNATQAAIRTGYSDKTSKQISSKLLTKVDIREYIDQLMIERSSQIMVDAYYVIENLKLIVQDGIQKVPVFFGEIPAGYDAFHNPNSANKALESLGKHLGIFVEKVDHSSSDGSMTPVREGMNAFYEDLEKEKE